MRKLTMGLITLSLYGLGFDALAQEAYVTGSLGRSGWNFECGPRQCDRNSTAWRVAAGYRLNRVVAFEGFHFPFGRARSSDFSLDGELGGTATGIQTLLGWQFGEFGIAGKLGWASVRTDFRAAPTSTYRSSNARHGELIGGLVGDYRITPALSIRLDVDIVTVALESTAIYYSRGADVTTLSMGLNFRF